MYHVKFIVIANDLCGSAAISIYFGIASPVLAMTSKTHSPVSAIKMKPSFLITHEGF